MSRHKIDRRGHTLDPWTELTRENRPQRRPATRRKTGNQRRGSHLLVRLPAGRTPVGVVVVVETVQRTDQRQLVSKPGQPRHQLADVDPGHPGRDRPEFPANHRRRLGLQIVHVQVRRSPGQQQHDDALDRPIRRSRHRQLALGFRSQDLRQRQPAQRQPADLQATATRHAIAVPRPCSGNRQHQQPSISKHRSTINRENRANSAFTMMRLSHFIGSRNICRHNSRTKPPPMSTFVLIPSGPNPPHWP